MRTYGQIVVKDRHLLIKPEWHIMVRLKRHFARINEADHGIAQLLLTEETAREILWFCQRYPMNIRLVDQVLLERMAKQHVDREELIAQSLATGFEPRRFELALPPRAYQAEAADLLLRSRRLLLADEFGVGKTLSAIAALTDPATRPALVVTLAHLPRQWAREIARFAPALRTHIIKSGTPYDIVDECRRERMRAGLPKEEPRMPDVLLTNYHKLSGWADVLAPVIRDHLVVFDEGQELRRDKTRDPETGLMVPTKKYAAAAHLSEAAGYRCILSGTPFYNHGIELHSVMNIVEPDCLGTKEEFKREWCSGERVEDPRALGRHLRAAGLMLRRTRKDVGQEIAKVSKVIHPIDANLSALDKVSASVAELARLILRDDKAGKGDKFRAAEEFSNQLRLATGLAKAPAVADFVRMVVENGEKVLLFGWHRSVYDVWLKRLQDLDPVMFTGSESPKQKEQAVRRFCAAEEDGGTDVLIMSLRAGAGLDGLQKICKTSVHGELDWSPGVIDQNVGRIARPGQENPVMALFPVADYGADPVMIDVLGLKRAQIEGVCDPDAELLEQLEVDENHIKRMAEDYLRRHGGA